MDIPTAALVLLTLSHIINTGWRIYRDRKEDATWARLQVRETKRG